VGALLLLFGLLLKAFALSVASKLPGAWVWLYTADLPERSRTRRQLEVRSDLWEQLAESRSAGSDEDATAVHILARLLAGVPADLFWRYSHERAAFADALLFVSAATMPFMAVILNASAGSVIWVALIMLGWSIPALPILLLRRRWHELVNELFMSTRGAGAYAASAAALWALSGTLSGPAAIVLGIATYVLLRSAAAAILRLIPAE
jgi:hypothetical protein